MVVDDGKFTKLDDKSSFMVACDTGRKRNRGGDDDSERYLDSLRKKSKLSLTEVEFVAAHEPCAGSMVDKYKRWLITWTKLKRIDEIGAVEGSYMANANVVEQVNAHKAYIAMVTENPDVGLNPESYLLSAAFVKNYDCYGANFLKQWVPYVCEALNSAQPHPFKSSGLMWYTIDHLELMVDFLEKMCVPRGDIATEEDKKIKGDKGIELLFHWMFHVWGFGYRVPQNHKIEFEYLGQVESEMASF
jgi:hypothetical protein